MTTTVDRPVPVATDWVALGCAVRLVVQDPKDLRVAQSIVTDTLAAIDLACSRFRVDSELSRLGAGTGRAIAVSPLFADAIAAALDAAAITDGDVDPTLGSEMVAAGYDRDYARIERNGAAITIVGSRRPIWREIALDRKALTVTMPVGARLDLGATAKALAADLAAAKVAAAIDGRGVLVSLGGDIAVAGEAPYAGWTIRVQDETGPVATIPNGPTQRVAIGRGGLATSSTTARRWVRGGAVMHHILDPRNGVPVASPWRTVSVVAPSCLEANVASTAAIVRGESALEWLSRRGLAARFVANDGQVTLVAGWPESESDAR